MGIRRYLFGSFRLKALRRIRAQGSSNFRQDLKILQGKSASKLSFLAAGIGTAPWAAIMPYVKERLALTEMHYASLLLCFGLGAVIGMPLTGRLVHRFGVKKVIFCAVLGLYAGMAGLGLESLTLPWAYVFVILWGMSLGILDVANNIHGALLEELSSLHLMSSFHGFYTLGCIGSALLCAAGLYSGMHTLTAMGILSGAGIVLLLALYSNLIDTHGHGAAADEEKQDERTRDAAAKSQGQGSGQEDRAEARRPVPPYLTAPIVVIGLVCTIMYLTDGMIYDWSAVYLITNGGVDIAVASVGYLSFQTAIALMRFKGDEWVAKIGPARFIGTGGLIASACMLIIALSSNSLVIIACFFVCGLALSNAVPVMFSETARRSGAWQGQAIAWVGTLGYSGLLLGPALLGSLASLGGLSLIYLFTSCLLFVMGIMAYAVLRARKN